MDPITALSLASTAFKGVQTLVARGREIEDVAVHLGRWYGYAADIKEAEKESQKPPIFRKLLDSGSVEQEALNSIIVKKKLEEQERQIRDLLVIRYGIETYREMIQMRKDIKSKREKLVYAQRRRRKSILDFIAVLVGGFICFAIVYGFYELLMNFSR